MEPRPARGAGGDAPHVHVLPRFGAPGRGVQVMGEGAGQEDLAALGEALRSA
jgi:hypothetical protein